MKIRAALSLIWCVAFALGLGCKSYGPRFNPYQPASESSSALAGQGTSRKLAKLDQNAFSSIEFTNRINPEWLKAPSNFYKLGPGDIIEIEIVGTPNSMSDALVGPDGKIYYGLLPGEFVWGLTLSQTKDLLERELGKYVRVKPEMVLTLKAVGSKQVWILGNVASPGVYSLAVPMTLLEAISVAGGTIGVPGSTEDLADLQHSFVMRDGKMLSVDFERLLRKGDFTQNIYLQSGDFIYLRPAAARNVYVLGAVAQPNLVPFSGTISLVSAISSVGGTLPDAYNTHVAVIRGSLAHPEIAIVDYKAMFKGKAMDIKLEAGDLVYVPFSPYRKLELFAEQVIAQFVSTVAINEGYRAVIKGASPVGVSVPGGIYLGP
ncbi:MAG: SLBB domain-containing protein [Candidatus Omnitrophica bacterium]|nr:SLBB domain-containing protein [Candidatus Omnitrophota bacterium]